MKVVWLDYIVIIIYCVVLLGIGFHFSKERKNTVTYLLGGRNMGYITIGLACLMSMLSSVSIVMIPGEIVNNGLTYFVFTPLVNLLCIPCYLIFLRFYFKLGSFTPYEYLEYRYDGTIRAAVAFVAFYFRVLFIASVLYTTAKIFEAAYGWSPAFSVLLMGGIGLIYTIMGGSKAVIWSDVFQFFVLFGSVGIVLVLLCSKIDGGAVGAVKVAFEQGHGLLQFKEKSFYSLSPYVRLLFWLMLWGAITSPLVSASSDQITIQRLLSTKNWKEGFKANIVSSVLTAFSTLLLWFMGFAIFTYYFQNPDPALSPGSGDKALFHFVSTYLPSPLSGLFIAGMLAAVMSTIASASNALATLYLKEFHQKYFNKNLDTKLEVRVSMYATAGIGIFAILFAFGLELSGRYLKQSVVEVETLFSFLGVIVFPAFIFAVLSKRANSQIIWGYAFYCLGESISMRCWYAMSRASVQAWEKDPSVGFGWGGKLDWQYAIPFVVAGLLLCTPYLFKTIRDKWQTRASALIGLACLGAAETLFIWVAYSNYLITDFPREKSFAFSVPFTIFIAFGIMWFCPKPPKHKYQGLTLSTIGEDVVAPHNTIETSLDS